MKKQCLALILALALLAGVPTVASAASAAATIPPAFTDISDPAVAESADLLRLLGIVNGTGGNAFRPQGTLTRAEFCKMAVELLGQGDQAASQMNRTVFRDVPSTHWARGYINVATQSVTTGETTTPGMIRGDATGAFHPDDPITFAEAVTILMRVLGYGDATVGFGAAWYDGYLATAKQIELTEGLSPASPVASITRGDAALLFSSLIYTKPMGSQDIFLKSALGGSVTDSQLVLEVKGQAASDGGWAFRTAEKNYRTRRDNLSDSFRGLRCKLVLDKEGDVLALQRDEDYTTRTLHIVEAEARYVVTDQREQVLVSTDTPVWQADQTQRTYVDAYKEILSGTTAVFCYDKTAALCSIYLMGNSATTRTAVVKEGSRPFEGAWDATPTAVYKNGVPATLAAAKPYDVATYDSTTGVLTLSDRKLTGVYEDATPSPVSPNQITVMGWDRFNVLDCALKDLSQFKLGDQVTLLLDAHNNVAGVVSPNVASGRGYGIATITKGAPDARGRDTYTASVELSIGITVKGKVRSNDQELIQAPGRLYAVTSSQLGELTLATARSQGVGGNWQTAQGRIGPLTVSPTAAVYDRAGYGPMVKVELDSVTTPDISAGKITFLHTDSMGTVDIVALDNCTGDAYTYGLIAYTPAVSTEYSFASAIATVSDQGSSLQVICNANMAAYDKGFLGVNPTLTKSNGMSRIDSTRPLTARSGVSRTDFKEDYVTIDGVAYPLASNIDSHCYNTISESWFSSLDAALSYSSTLTVYFDALPSQGGKIRLVAVE